MSKAKDSAIVLCMTTAELPVPDLNLATNPMKDHCAGCGAEVWVSGQTLERVARESPAIPVLIVCNDCGDNMIENLDRDEVDWRLTPQQRHLLPVLPRGRTNQRRTR